jgi:hypothetical protein
MRKLWVVILAVCVVFSMAAVAQEAAKSCDMGKDKAAAAPLKSLKGTVKAEGDKVTFVSDADQKSWDVMNPEKLKEHDGHHVQVSAHVYADKNSIHVMSVKMLKAAKEKPSM